MLSLVSVFLIAITCVELMLKPIYHERCNEMMCCAINLHILLLSAILSIFSIFTKLFNVLYVDLLHNTSFRCSVRDKSTYSTLNNFVKIEKIDKIADKSSEYTHLITLVLDCQNKKAPAERIILKKNDLPNWVEQRNGISAKQAINNKGTTGIKYIIGGVADAYKDIENLAEIKFTMSNK